MATNQNPDQEQDRNRHTQNPPPTDQRHREKPMDDPGRGQGDKFEKQLPGNEKDQEPRSSRDA